MATIVNEIQVSGRGLMDGKESNVKLAPSSKEGIYFYPENSEAGIKASIDNVISTLQCTVLGHAGMQVRVVEHFMAACAFAGIDCLDVYMSSSELPILDGSALRWIEAFIQAGISKNNYDTEYTFTEPVYYSAGNTNLVLLPSETFKVSYNINFNHPDLERKWYSWDSSMNSQEIVEARTFGYLKDLEKFQQAGFALGVQVDNTVGLTDDGYTIELRSKDEPIKHKILDLIGDLNLLEINPLRFKAHIIAQEAGHKAHVEFGKVIKNMLEKEYVSN